MFVILSAVQSRALREFLHPLPLLTSLRIIHLTSFYGCRCFGHKHCVIVQINAEVFLFSGHGELERLILHLATGSSW